MSGAARLPVPAPQRTRRAPLQRLKATEVVARDHLHAALRALEQRALDAQDLARAVGRACPDDVVRIGAVLERAISQGYLRADATGLLSLTEAGQVYARRLPVPLVPVAVPAEHRVELERRAALVAANQHDPHALVRSQTRMAASAADLRPPPLRPGAERCLDVPSRHGDRLHYRDGRVTDLQGQPCL